MLLWVFLTASFSLLLLFALHFSLLPLHPFSSLIILLFSLIIVLLQSSWLFFFIFSLPKVYASHLKYDPWIHYVFLIFPVLLLAFTLSFHNSWAYLLARIQKKYFSQIFLSLYLSFIQECQSRLTPSEPHSCH